MDVYGGFVARGIYTAGHTVPALGLDWGGARMIFSPSTMADVAAINRGATVSCATSTWLRSDFMAL